MITILSSCRKENSDYIPDQLIDTVDIVSPNDFLYNLPISHDTLIIDADYNMDLRVDIEGYVIDSVFIKVDNITKIKTDYSIIGTSTLHIQEGDHHIQFLLRSINAVDSQAVMLQSALLPIHVIKNLSNRYIIESCESGRLKLLWPELDKPNTHKYQVVRYMGEDYQNSQTFEVEDSVFIDNFYVGEETRYRISVINHNGDLQYLWYYKKLSGFSDIYLSQNNSGGYNVKFDRCKFYNNFGSYKLTARINSDPVIVNSSLDVADTTFYIETARFADDARLWLECFPKDFPLGISAEENVLYTTYRFTHFGVKSFEYEIIASLNPTEAVYNSNNSIYKRNLATNQVVDSIVDPSASYNSIRATPGGDYIYSSNSNLSGPTACFWSSTAMTTEPLFTFHTDYSLPPVSDNLLAIKSVPGSSVPTKLGIYDVTNGNILYTTAYDASGNSPAISSDGQYYLISSSGLKLCSYINGIFSVIGEDSKSTKYYLFYEFNPHNPSTFYTWDLNDNFTIRSTADFSEINTYTLDLDKIINIDYSVQKIMGYKGNQIHVYDLNNGLLLNEIEANLPELFASGNYSRLLGNSIYCNQGVKYELDTQN